MNWTRPSKFQQEKTTDFKRIPIKYEATMRDMKQKLINLIFVIFI